MTTRRRALLPAIALLTCCYRFAPAVAAPAVPPPAPAPPPLTLAVHSLDLPGAPPDGVFMDYLAYDPARHRVWVPAGNTGSVDVVEVADGKITRVQGFKTAEMERRGKKVTVGPSSASVGDGVVYVGNRGDSSVCAIDAASLERGGCVTLDSTPDGVVYVAATREVWVTTPRAKTIAILDAGTPGKPAARSKIVLDGEPEGYAVDSTRGVFYTNLEDQDRTLAIDLKERKVVHTWLPACGEEGPRGLALDGARNLLMVACPDHVVVLDAGHDGKALGHIDTGEGIDSIDYVESRHELYAAASRAAKLTVARLDAQGQLQSLAVVPTAAGARNAVATESGAAYMADSRAGKILIAAPAR